jgi:hypothetical protein
MDGHSEAATEEQKKKPYKLKRSKELIIYVHVCIIAINNWQGLGPGSSLLCTGCADLSAICRVLGK